MCVGVSVWVGWSGIHVAGWSIIVLGLMCVGVSVWLGWSGIRVAGWSTTASTCNTDTTPTQPHRNSNTHRNNNTTNVAIQQNSRKLLMMDILMSETCWAHKKWNKIASDIKLVFYSSTITMMHGPINISYDRIILVIFSQAMYKAPWWWMLCDPKHVGVLLNIL